jgi:ABC-2 type transport system ATP-binding protein
VPVIELFEATKARGTVTVLDAVDLAVDAGELVAVLGPNGAGKTTLFELLLGLSTPTSGTATVFGTAPGRAGVGGRVGAMLQDAGLPDNLTARELVRLVARSCPRALGVDAVLDRVGLGDRRHRTIAKLSGGERQRVLLAMATVGCPDLLLLDEPTAAMDPDATRSFWRHARAAVADGTTLVFATHDMADADRIAERIVVLAKGRIVLDATPAALKDRYGMGLEDAYLALTDPRQEGVA